MVTSAIVRVFGKVQGVYFRQRTKEKAEELGLKGFVQNETNGSVYIEIEGENAAVEALIAWCHQGPSRASVAKVEIEGTSKKDFSHFEIKR